MSVTMNGKRIVYISLIDLGEMATGVAKKIMAQCYAMHSLGFDVDVIYMTETGMTVWNIDSNQRDSFPLKKDKGMLFYSSVIKYIRKKADYYDYAYVRLPYPSLKIFSYPLVFSLKKTFACNLIVEIPTFPFIQESKTFKSRCYNLYLLFFSLIFRKKIDVISYMGAQRDKIWGVKAIRIFNSVPLNKVRVKEHIAHEGINFIGVAQLAYWHGYDRVITGIAEYQKMNGAVPVSFHIVGNSLSGDGGELQRLKELAQKLGVKDSVIFHGSMHGEKLDALFDSMDIAVDSLGRHRSGNDYNCSLKSKEYCARGIPFIKSHLDDSFLGTGYYYQCSADDLPIDMSDIVTWFYESKFESRTLREYAEKVFDWRVQLSKVFGKDVLHSDKA
ncbi:glycosyltransferase [Serratia marcescens]|uniref:glycosyltransferase n=1 Tax=Serratia marcescens TaxID=615 RepID=UPI00313DF01F